MLYIAFTSCALSKLWATVTRKRNPDVHYACQGPWGKAASQLWFLKGWVTQNIKTNKKKNHTKCFHKALDLGFSDPWHKLYKSLNRMVRTDRSLPNIIPLFGVLMVAFVCVSNTILPIPLRCSTGLRFSGCKSHSMWFTSSWSSNHSVRMDSVVFHDFVHPIDSTAKMFFSVHI